MFQRVFQDHSSDVSILQLKSLTFVFPQLFNRFFSATQEHSFSHHQSFGRIAPLPLDFQILN